jgi:iron complex outermembrane receptor protein
LINQLTSRHNPGFGELSTEEYEDLRLHIGYTLKVLGSSVQLFLSGRNLTDDEQRYHTSFIKDLAPQPGRTIEVGFQMEF